VAHQRGLARAQVAVQGDEGVGQQGLPGGQRLREGSGVVLAVPAPAARALRARAFLRGRERGAFYNRAGMWCNSQLVPQMQEWARELGFSQIGVAGVDLSAAEEGLMQWLAQGFHGEMHYMASHGTRRARPAELVPGTVSV